MSPIKPIIEQLEFNNDKLLLKQLYKTICNTKYIDIDYFMNTEKKGYTVMFMITLIAKLKGNECFQGDIFTEKRRQFVIDNKDSNSPVIRLLASKILEHENALDYFIGSFLGQCIGDALGFLVEGQSTTTCKKYVEEIITQLQVPPAFGQYSDDSQLARELYVAVYQNDGVLNPAVYANRIACLFQPGHYRIVGYGKTTAQAGEALYNGKHYSESGLKNTTGNGAAMRAAPFGLLMHDKSTSEICDTVRVFSSITHASEQSVQGSIAIALATRTSFISRNHVLNIFNFLNHVAGGVTDLMYKSEIVNIINLLDNDEFAKKRFVFFGKGLDESQWGDGISTGVYQSTLWALYSFCKYPDDYIKCISQAISCGGDVDTTAAMAGAIIGARLGREKLPTVYVNKLHDRGAWNTEQLVNLVKCVYEPEI